MIPIRISVFERGAAGVPSTTLHANLHERITSYQHTISDRYGYESMSVTLVTSIEEALDWISDRLMSEAVVTNPDGGVIWQGFLTAVELRVGQETRTVSLDNMANRIKTKYTLTTGGGATTSSTSNTTSQALYGIKDLVVTLPDTTATGAANKATRVLNELKYPRATGSINVATGPIGDIALTLTFAGWYATLAWVVTSRTSTSTTSTTTQVGALIGTASPGIGATNAFLSTSTAGIVSSGISDTEYIEPDTPYSEKIEHLLDQGNSAGNSLAWGVYDGRQFIVEVAADAAPDTIHYQRSLGAGIVRDTGGAAVEWWNVRPNKMYQVKELLDLNTTVQAPDAGGVSYISRVSCAVSRERAELTLEGRTGQSVDRIIARVR